MKKPFLIAGAILMFSSFASTFESGRLVGRVTAGKMQKHPVIVFVAARPGRASMPTNRRPALDQRNKIFMPRILAVVVGSTVEFKNNDPVMHNIFSPDGEKYNLGTWVGTKVKSYTFKKPGVYRQLCNIHPEMLAYIVVLETPLFALTDLHGKFEIPGIPEGRHTVKVWGEKLNPSQLAAGIQVDVIGSKTTSVELNLHR